MLRKISGTKRDEIREEWRMLHNSGQNALYSSPNIIRYLKCRRLRRAGQVESTEKSRIAYRVLMGRPEGKWSLGRLRCRWEDNIRVVRGRWVVIQANG